MGGLLDVIAKLGPWANNFVLASVNGWLDRFTTHLSLVSAHDSVFTSDVVVFVDGELGQLILVWHVCHVGCLGGHLYFYGTIILA